MLLASETAINLNGLLTPLATETDSAPHRQDRACCWSPRRAWPAEPRAGCPPWAPGATRDGQRGHCAARKGGSRTCLSPQTRKHTSPPPRKAGRQGGLLESAGSPERRWLPFSLGLRHCSGFPQHLPASRSTWVFCAPLPPQLQREPWGEGRAGRCGRGRGAQSPFPRGRRLVGTAPRWPPSCGRTLYFLGVTVLPVPGDVL